MQPESIERLFLRALICGAAKLTKGQFTIGRRPVLLDQDDQGIPKDTPALRSALGVAIGGKEGGSQERRA